MKEFRITKTGPHMTQLIS